MLLARTAARSPVRFWIYFLANGSFAGICSIIFESPALRSTLTVITRSNAND